MPKPAAVTRKTAVRGSRTGRPIMALLDLLGRRWTLRIVWELRDGPLTSRALRTACDDASPTVMQARLSELREAGLVELLAGDGYRLTALGRELMESFLPLHHFAERWSIERLFYLALRQARAEFAEGSVHRPTSHRASHRSGWSKANEQARPPPPSGSHHRPARP